MNIFEQLNVIITGVMLIMVLASPYFIFKDKYERWSCAKREIPHEFYLTKCRTLSEVDRLKEEKARRDERKGMIRKGLKTVNEYW